MKSGRQRISRGILLRREGLAAHSLKDTVRRFNNGNLTAGIVDVDPAYISVGPKANLSLLVAPKDPHTLKKIDLNRLCTGVPQSVPHIMGSFCSSSACLLAMPEFRDLENSESRLSSKRKSRTSTTLEFNGMSSVRCRKTSASCGRKESTGLSLLCSARTAKLACWTRVTKQKCGARLCARMGNQSGLGRRWSC